MIDLGPTSLACARGTLRWLWDPGWAGVGTRRCAVSYRCRGRAGVPEAGAGLRARLPRGRPRDRPVWHQAFPRPGKHPPRRRARRGYVLFLIGLEMRPAKLWNLRREIFGLDRAGADMRCAAFVYRGSQRAAAGLAVIGAMGFVLSSTAVIAKMMDDSGDTATGPVSATSQSCCSKI